MDFQLARVLESQQRDFRRRIWHACARERWPQAGVGARTPRYACASRHTEPLPGHALPLFAAPAGAQAHYIVTGWRAKGKIMAKP